MGVIESLQKFGLTEKEAKTYLATLELGSSSASFIAIKSDLPRTLTYDLLERLINLGLVTYSIKDNKKYFVAADPKQLIRMLSEKEIAVKQIIPQLEMMQKIKGTIRPRIEIYEGIEGMKTMMNDILNSKPKEFYAYGSSKVSIRVIPAFMNDWHARRIKQKLMMYAIYNNTPKTRKILKDTPKTNQYLKYRIMPIELDGPTATLIYGNRVVMQSWAKEPFSVAIDDELMAENQRRYFWELWALGKKMN